MAYTQVTGMQIQAVFGTFWLVQWALQGPTFLTDIAGAGENMRKSVPKL